MDIVYHCKECGTAIAETILPDDFGGKIAEEFYGAVKYSNCSTVPFLCNTCLCNKYYELQKTVFTLERRFRRALNIIKRRNKWRYNSHIQG